MLLLNECRFIIKEVCIFDVNKCVKTYDLVLKTTSWIGIFKTAVSTTGLHELYFWNSFQIMTAFDSDIMP